MSNSSAPGVPGKSILTWAAICIVLLPLSIIQGTAGLHEAWIWVASATVSLFAFFLSFKSLVLPRKAAMLLAAFLAWNFISAFFSGNAWSVQHAAQLSMLLVFTAGFFTVLASGGHLLIFSFFSVAAFLLSLLALFQYFTGDLLFIPPHKPHIPYATLLNENLLAEILVLILPMNVWQLGNSTGARKVFFILNLILIISAILATQCRAAWVALAFILLVFIVLHLSRAQKIVFILPAALIALLIFQAGYYAWRAEGAKDLPVSVQPTSSSLEERLILARSSMRMAGDQPLTGVGPGMWSVRANEYEVRGWFNEYGTRYYNTPHNVFLQSLSETGVPGCIFLILLLCLPLFWLAKEFKTADGPSRQMISVATAGLGAWFVFSLTAFPFSMMYHLVVFGFYLALTFSLLKKNMGTGTPVPVKILCVLIALSGVVLGGLRFRNEFYFSWGMEIWEKGKPDFAADKWRDVNTEFLPFDERTGTPVLFYQSIALHLSGDYEGEYAALKESYDLNPGHPLAGNNLAVAMMRRGERDAAMRTWRSVLKYHRDFPVAAENAVLCLLSDSLSGNSEKHLREVNDILHDAFPEHENEKETELRTRLSEQQFPFRGFYYNGIRGVLD